MKGLKMISLSQTIQIHIVDLSWFARVNAHVQIDAIGSNYDGWRMRN